MGFKSSSRQPLLDWDLKSIFAQFGAEENVKKNVVFKLCSGIFTISYK